MRIDQMNLSTEITNQLESMQRKMESIDQLILSFVNVAKDTFLAKDRNSNFPSENTIPETHKSHNETGLP
jgi:hypothetical protein